MHTFPAPKRRRSRPTTPTRRIIKALSTFARVDYTQGRTTSASAGSARSRRRWARTSSAARRSTTGRSSSTRTIACSTSAGRRCSATAPPTRCGSRTSARTASTATSPTWASTRRNWNTSGWIDDLEFVGLNGRDQFDIGSLNEYADFETGLAAAHGGADSRNYTLQDAFTYVTGGGDHTLKTGFTYNRSMVGRSASAPTTTARSRSATTCRSIRRTR